jgi:phosphohistidine phosphatase SixA
VTLLLIRHAEAGSPTDWDGEDHLRPLSEVGHDQASRLVPLWHKEPLKRILSSPHTRCIQTMEPLAAALGLDVEPVEELAEGHARDALRLVHEIVGEDAALCTHGDVVPELLQALESEGVHILAEWKWRKASTWVLHTENGAITHATYVPRPI